VENAFALADGLPLKLDKLVAVWRAKCVDGRLPSRDDFTPRDLKPWLSNLALLERIPEGGYRFRVCGTGLIHRFGCDATGRAVEELTEELRIDLRNRLDRSSTLQMPIVACLQILVALKCADYSELILPLANKDAQVSMLLLATYPARQMAFDSRRGLRAGETWSD